MEVALSRLAGTAYLQADGIIVGRMLGDSALGTYRLAISLASGPADKVAMLIMRVTGPLFAKIQDDATLIRRYFMFISDALALAIFPLVFGLAVVAPEVVSVVLGPKWQQAIVPMQWLAVFMAFRTMNTLMTQVLTSLRFTTFLLWMSIVSFLIMPASFAVAARWDTGAVAAAWMITTPVTMLPPALKLFRVIQSGIREYVQVLLPATIATAIMVLAVLGTRLFVISHFWPAFWSLSVQVVVGALAYAGVLLTFYRPRVMRYVQFILRVRSDRNAVVEEIH